MQSYQAARVTSVQRTLFVVALLMSAALPISDLAKRVLAGSDQTGQVIPAESAPSRPPTEAVNEVPPTALDQLIEQLDSGDYVERTAATTALLAHPDAASVLIERTQSGPVEAAHRALDLLGTLYAHSEAERFDQIDEAFQTLAESGQTPLAARAMELLEIHQAVREKQAIETIRRLGGVLTYMETPVWGAEPAEPLLVAVAIGQQWTGGDESLRYIRRLSTVRTIFDVRGNTITPAGWDDLRAAIPDLTIVARGAARLGIEGRDYIPAGCQVGRIQPDSAADLAGLEVGDIIYQFGTEPVVDFESLIELIATKGVGDVVPLAVRRQEEDLTIEVKLLGWD